MKIERANLAAYIEIALEVSSRADIIMVGEQHESMRTQQIRDILTAIENGEQLEIV